MNVIYLDVLFLSNLTFNILSLYITSHFTSTKLRPFLAMLGAIIASLAGVWLLVFCQSLWLFIPVAIISFALLLCFSFSTTGARALARQGILLLFSLFLCGALAHYFLLFGIRLFGVVEESGRDGKALLFAGISILTGFILSMSSKALKRQNQKKTIIAEIRLAGKAVKCVCLVDSGNLLKDPMDGKPVLLLSQEVADQLIGDKQLYLTMSRVGDARILYHALSVEWQKRIRMIPYHTINQNGLMVCLSPDFIFINNIRKNALIGICPISQKQNMGICPQALLP